MLLTAFTILSYSLLFILSVAFLFLLHRYVVYRKHCKMVSHIPGHCQFVPPPLVKFIPQFLRDENWITDMGDVFSLDTLLNSQKKFKTDHYKMVFGFLNAPMIIIDNPKMGKEIATKKKFKKPNMLKSAQVELFSGTNIFVEDEYHTWLHQRQLMDPSFTPESLRMVAHVTSETVRNDMIPFIESNRNGNDIMGDFAKLTMNVIGIAGFGYNFDTFNNKDENSLEKKSALYINSINTYRTCPKVIRNHINIGLFGKVRDAATCFKQAIGKIIQKREIHEENESTSDDQKSDVLSILLRERKTKQKDENGSLTNDELISNSFVLLVAGHETTARTLGFATFVLATNETVQQQVHEFIDGFVKQNNGREHFDYDDFASGKLDYLRALFRETLRLYPVALGVPRELTSNSSEFNNVLLPKGSLVLYSWANTLRNEEYWKDAETFNPLRFLKDEDERRMGVFGALHNPQTNPFVYSVFGIGGRVCIGRYFSEVESVIALAYLTRKYSFKLSDPNYKLVLKTRVTLSPQDTILIDYVPRN
ncbi:predicted protein [Naegleria gruberi]|uniref:Predicted protein n=1 Tax=Naegleria gruberi TaxID=5762 RepID=D2V8I9_NAEGR|nr:uncharacterized protein NAEGRDRAFT_65172 [Naegleria gruberi]EFC46693.1 predicted protein [Naegleria gruberi]|eukprot:XP_002679437.1 predicted protein [Naegleria gruberi strain NEG-M]